jgi:hypothetical protein
MSKTLHSKTQHERQKGHIWTCHSNSQKSMFLHKLKKYFKTRRTATSLRGVRLLHDNAHKAANVREYLKQEKVVELPNPPYSPDLTPCGFFLFPRHKNHTLLEENIKREKLSVRTFSSV